MWSYRLQPRMGASWKILGCRDSSICQILIGGHSEDGYEVAVRNQCSDDALQEILTNEVCPALKVDREAQASGH